MEENKEEIAKLNNDNIENENKNKNINENLDEVPEPNITEEEMKSIINYINTWDYEKYERDLEVREALLLLRNKMKQEEEEKEKQLKQLKKKEDIITETNINNDTNQNIKKIFEEEKIEGDNKYFTNYNDNNNSHENVFKDELSEQEKEFLEKNWNRSTKPDFGEKIVNEKGDKEIVINENMKVKKVNNYMLLILLLLYRIIMRKFELKKWKI